MSRQAPAANVGSTDWDYRLGSPSNSEASAKIHDELLRFIFHKQELASEQAHNELLRNLEVLYDSHSADGWDGDGAKMVFPEALSSARLLVQNLSPGDIPPPDIAVTNDGLFSMDWENPSGDSLTLIVKPLTIIWAVLYANGDEAHGVSAWNGEIPRAIMFHIDQINRSNDK